MSEKSIIFIDTEVDPETNIVIDCGAVNENGEGLHIHSVHQFHEFMEGYHFVCGHNILAHDLQFIQKPEGAIAIDTLPLSPLLFPNRPYHALLKDDKLQTDALNNPQNDAIKAKDLFFDEVTVFKKLDKDLQDVYASLLYDQKEFSGFWTYLGRFPVGSKRNRIRDVFAGRICDNAPLKTLIKTYPVELAYCLALITATDRHSVIPHWVHVNYPNVDYVMRSLRSTPCGECAYCRNALDARRQLKHYFGYDNFRKYNDEPLQENAVNAAIRNESLLAIFPTGGGKSLTFQIPALMTGESSHALTIVISPLQSLMKDQVDNLEKRGIAEAVTINGLLSPIERQEAIERVESGIASIVYISPESLRSKTIERLFMSRTIARFVIDEAHCFSAWGQDFRVDYLYIGDFIRALQEQKGLDYHIPVSCFTATAKQKVISDIKDYFKNKLGLELRLFATNASRTNLRYEVLYKETEDEKYTALRNLIEVKDCPTIVYVSRTKRTRELAEKLAKDGFKARPFNGKMDSSEKQENQEAFINDEVQIIVATSAFGMGVDKANVKLVIHFDISDSLENYVQEAGRAGRDQSLQAECYVLFNDNDLDKHFMLLNQTKLSISEIQQVWKAIKDLTRNRPHICCSPLEIARQAGWDDSGSDMETRVKTAIQALENAGYVKRGRNVPRVYATSILVPNMIEAGKRIDASPRILEDERQTAKRIIKSLISSRSIARAGNDDAESRVDYLADRLGLEKRDVIHTIQNLREDGLLADSKDLTAYIRRTDTLNRSLQILKRFSALESFLLEVLPGEGDSLNLKELNEKALSAGIRTSSVNAIRTIFYYWQIRSYIQKSQDANSHHVILQPQISYEKLKEKREQSFDVADFIVRFLFQRSMEQPTSKDEILVLFSVLELQREYNQTALVPIQADAVEEALLYLAKISAMKLEGGFLVLYSGMELDRLVTDNKIRYKIEDYRQLNEYYKQKIQQIHIVGEFANMMVRDYAQALQFVNDYFQMDYKQFLQHYFAGERAKEIQRNVTPGKYEQLFHTLSEAQTAIIQDSTSPHIVVTAGPGSGKTKVLVHKLASLLLLEDVKHEQLLMVTFSRAAAIEFKVRLRELIGNAAAFVEIKTFHSYCFDLLGKIGSLQESENVVRDAAAMIRNGDVEPGRITKTVLVIDEAQDMDIHEFSLIEALIERNEEMRVIAVGDDDQNIYQFRGSDSGHLRTLITKHHAKQYDLLENYRSSKKIVSFANCFAETITHRMKTAPIIPVSDQEGEVRLIHHVSSHLEMAVMDDMMRTHKDGTVCILTTTNQEALCVLGLLKQRNVPAKLIQTNDGFDLYNIAEIRYFIKKIAERLSSPVIDEEIWVEAKSDLQERYSRSEALPLILDILDGFSETHPRMYQSDFEVFLHESKLEDFYKTEQGIVMVSTIHKAKGREFDSVYMLIDNMQLNSDEERRKLYVGITRAKEHLHIHYNNHLLDAFRTKNVEFSQDSTIYDRPNEIMLQLGFRDIFLDFSKAQSALIIRMQSGQKLAIQGSQLLARTADGFIPVVRFSKAFQEKICKLTSQRYQLVAAKVRFVVAWKKKEDTSESAILLPDLFLKYI